MKIATPTSLPLDNLLKCAHCGVPMHLEANPDLRYICHSRLRKENSCGTPALKATDLNRLIIREVMSSIITDATSTAFQTKVNLALADAQRNLPEVERDRPWDEETTRRRATDPTWTLLEDRAPEAGAILSTFIDAVQVGSGTAEVRYSVPLPAGTPLAGSIRQQITLPESVLA